MRVSGVHVGTVLTITDSSDGGALVKMALLPFLAPPDFGWLMRHGSYDLIGFYEKMRAKAGEFGLAYDNEQYYERLMQVL